MLVLYMKKIFTYFIFKHIVPLLDNAPNDLIGCIIQKRYKLLGLIDHVHKDFYSALTNFIIKGPGTILYLYYSLMLLIF